MDFACESNEVGECSLQTWYGAPQHEGAGGSDWESEYYGEASEEDPAGPVEFVPEVEPSGVFPEDDRVSKERPARPLSASD